MRLALVVSLGVLLTLAISISTRYDRPVDSGLKVRCQDAWGSGHYLAPRGSRLHRGVDFICKAGEPIKPLAPGYVTKIGYPYSPLDPKKGHLRYVEVTGIDGYRLRYFYVKIEVSVGSYVKLEGESSSLETILGTSQDLSEIYPGITQHYHFEVINKLGVYVNPHEYLGLLTR